MLNTSRIKQLCDTLDKRVGGGHLGFLEHLGTRDSLRRGESLGSGPTLRMVKD